MILEHKIHRELNSVGEESNHANFKETEIPQN